MLLLSLLLLLFCYLRVSIEVVLDLAPAKLLLERGLAGCVEHLLADLGVVRGPADKDPKVGVAGLLI